MGLFHVGCKIENHKDGKSTVVPKLMVDTGSEYTWVQGKVLEQIGIERRKKDLQFQMANGQIITRSVGYAILRVHDSETTDEVVFGEAGDLTLLGCRALEGLGLRVDSRAKKLVAAGPVMAASAVRPHVAQAMGIIVGQESAPKLKPRPGHSSKAGKAGKAGKATRATGK